MLGKTLRVFFLMSAVLWITACAVGPDYRRPVTNAPDAFRFAPADADGTSDAKWWEQFSDPVLEELIRTALANNKDLRIASTRVEAFAARLFGSRSGYFPQVDYAAAASRASGALLAVPTPAGKEFDALLNARWELDLWGRLRRENEAARAELLATAHARRGVILTVVASVAQSYITLRVLDRQLEIAQRTLSGRAEAMKLVEQRRQTGYASDIEIAQVRFLYENAASEIPQLESAVARYENALSILLGRNPGAVSRGLSLEHLDAPQVLTGVPSELLERRPDIVQAEQSLVAANAQLGVARAQYFPSISLTGLLGSSSAQLEDLFTSPARTWSYAAQLTGPLFNGGRVRALNRVAKAQRQEAVLQYEQTIQNAFREVEDALIGTQKTRERAVSLAREEQAAADYARLAQESYTQGYSGYFQVLDAQRSLFSTQLLNAQAQGDRLLSLIGLYKVMGGGWIDEADAISQRHSDTSTK